MRMTKFHPAGILLLGPILAAVGCTTDSEPKPQSSQGGSAPAQDRTIADGKALYAKHCATCHGAAGKGDGPAAEYLAPQPRDLTSGTYKLTSCASGDLPTDEDLLRTITRGMPGSAMPAFEHLSEQDRRALVAYIKTLATVQDEGRTVNLFELYGPPRVIVPGKPPEQTPERIALGRKAYDRMQCASCHGDSGVGDGPSASTLVDKWGFPIPPANFTRGIFKGGDTVSDIYMRFTTGMNGTPMPSFEDNLTQEERWALAYYVQSLVKKDVKPLRHHSGRDIVARRVREVPLDPLCADWERAAALDVPVMLLWQRAEATNYVTVRALVSDSQIGFLLEWDDATVDGSALRPQDFTDAAAVMFNLTSDAGDITMGSKNGPVNIWQWRFSRQLDIAKFRDMEEAFPGMVADDYFSARSHYPKKDDFPGHLNPSSAPSHDPTYLSGWGSGNSLSDPTPKAAVEDLNAQGFGTLTPQPPAGQNVEGRGVWVAGRWKVTFRRSLAGDGPQDTAFAKGKPLFVSVAVWDGSSGDRNGKKAYSYWHNLKLE